MVEFALLLCCFISQFDFNSRGPTDNAYGGTTSGPNNRAYALSYGGPMVATGDVSSAYLAVGLMTLIGFAMPFGAFLTSYFVRPRVDPARPHKTKSWLLEGYEADHSLYPRRLSTYECGSEPVGDAMIQFHFQYYWYAIIFLVFDVAFMFMALGGMVTNAATVEGAGQAERELAIDRLLILLTFFAVMVAGVWHVFRKRGRIYI